MDEDKVTESEATGSTPEEVTEPSGMTEEQGQEIIDLLTEQNEKQLEVMEMTGEVPQTITFEQAQQLIDIMGNMNEGLFYLIIFMSAFFIWAVFKALYGLVGHIFSGL